MFFHSQTIKNSVKLGAVAYLLSGLEESLRCSNIMAIDGDFSVGWQDFAGQALEAICLASARDTQESKTLSELEPKRYFVNCHYFAVSFPELMHSYRNGVGFDIGNVYLLLLELIEILELVHLLLLQI